jgi:hypothetical protein
LRLARDWRAGLTPQVGAGAQTALVSRQEHLHLIGTD